MTQGRKGIVYRFYFLILFLLIFCGPRQYSLSQSVQPDSLRSFFAFHFDADKISTFTDSDFLLMEESGIRLLYLEGEVSSLAVSRLQNQPFRYFFSPGSSYLVSTGNRQADSLYLQNIFDQYQLITRSLQEKTAGFGIADYPYLKDDDTRRLMSLFAEELKSPSDNNLPLFFTTGRYDIKPMLPENLNFIHFVTDAGSDLPVAAGQLYSLSGFDNTHDFYRKLKNLLGKTEGINPVVIVIDGEFALEQLSLSDNLKTTIQNYQQKDAVVVPVPAPQPEGYSLNPPIVILLLILISYILHYRYQPRYRHSLGRFFFNHSFFTDDIIENRIQLTTPGFILLIQHIVMSGLMFYTVSLALLSNRGLESLFHHFPALNIFPQSHISMFFIGVMISALSKAVALLWLHLVNRKLQYFSQVLNLYAWPLQVNLVIVTLGVVALQTGLGENLMIFLFMIFLFTWYMSFNIAATDSARALEKNSVLYLAFTVGLNTLFFAAMIMIFFLMPEFKNPVLFAIWLG